VKIPTAELQRAHASAGYRVHVRVFDVLGDLTGSPSQSRPLPTAIEGSDGKLWFVLSNGAVSIDPANIPENKLVPPVWIQSISADGVVYRKLRSLKLPSDPADIRIDYTALSLSRKELSFAIS
jgi:hypothetical protein